MASDEGAPFRVVWSEDQRHQVRNLGNQANRSGKKAEFLAALREILSQLQQTPLTWGDPSYRLKSAGLDVFHGMYSYLHVYYGVDTTRRIVYIKEIAFLPGHGLE